MRDENQVPLLASEYDNENYSQRKSENGGDVLLDIDSSSSTATNSISASCCETTNRSQVLENGHANVCSFHQSDSELSSPFDFLGVAQNPSSSFNFTVVDPFRNNTPEIVGLYEWFKILLLLPLALLRVVLMGLTLAVGYLATKLALEGWKDRHNPMPKWRCKIMLITRFCARCILFSFGYHWIRRIGKPAPREVAPIVVANHISYTDPIFFFYELFPSFVASESHDEITFVGTVIRAMQVIYVDRACTASRKQAISEIKRKALCNDFPRVMLFPEGTTTNGRSLISFRLGAFVHELPIQPVVIRYPHVHFDQSWGTISVLRLMFRMFTQFHNFMEVEYLPLVFPMQGKCENPAFQAKMVRNEMSKALNVVQTQYSYGDLLLVNRASEMGLIPASAYMVEMANLETFLHLSVSEALLLLDKYISFHPDKSGCVDMENFLQAFDLGKCVLSEQIFHFIDSENEGTITFRKFLYMAAYILKHPKFYQYGKSAFELCDDNKRGYLTKKEVERLIKIFVATPEADDVSKFFKEFDVDNDEKISLVDFLKCLERNPLLIALWKPLFSLNSAS